MPLPAASADIPNGPGAAALLAAGIGSFLVGLFAVLADKSLPIARFMNFSKPTGPLSGVTTCAIVLWLASWAALHMRWRTRSVQFTRVSIIALVLLALSLLLTFPPLADML